MYDQKETLTLTLAKKQEALRELRAYSDPLKGQSAEIAGDWSKREDALVKEIADIKDQLAMVDSNASRT